MKPLHTDTQHAALGERIAQLRFMDIASLCQKVKGGALGFDFNRRFGGEDIKAEWGGIKRAFAAWAVSDESALSLIALAAALPEYEAKAQAYYAKAGKKTAANTPAKRAPAPAPVAPTTAPPATSEVASILAEARREAARMDDGRERAIMTEVNALQSKLDRLTLARPIILTVVAPDSTHTVELGPQHHMFTRMLKLAATRKATGEALNIWVTGPAGSGKTTAAANVSKALAIPFHFTGAVKDEFKLLGFMDAHGRLTRTPFREAYEHGGVFLFDEIDGSDAGALLAFNAALANGQCDFPDKIVERHPNCVIIAAANTWGSGPTAKYMGRAKLDAASLNRFVMLPWEYDEVLEMATSGNQEWCKKVQRMRKNAKDAGIDHVISPRATYDGAALLANGFDVADVASMVIRAGLSDQQWVTVTRGAL
jgi:cobaltochelatase CobS